MFTYDPGFRKIVSIFCFSVIAMQCFALPKSDLEKAIQAIDLPAVKEIVAGEKFTRAEREHYIELADELVKKRGDIKKNWTHAGDETTPQKGPSGRRVFAEWCLAMWLWFMQPHMAPRRCYYYCSPDPNYVALSMGLGGICWCVFLIDIARYISYQKIREQQIHKKLDDAVAIKQVIYSADIVDDEKKAA